MISPEKTRLDTYINKSGMGYCLRFTEGDRKMLEHRRVANVGSIRVSGNITSPFFSVCVRVPYTNISGLELLKLLLNSESIHNDFPVVVAVVWVGKL